MAVRPLVWVASFLYTAVLVSGVYYVAAGLCPDEPDRVRLGGFVALLVALLILERLPILERWGRPPSSRWVAVALLAGRAGLYAAVVVLDCAGFADALYLLLPFAGYLYLGRRVSYGLAGLVLGVAVLRIAVAPDGMRDPELISDLLMSFVGVVFAVSMAAVAVEARRSAARAADLAAATERNRVARDIHDSLGHHLTAIAVQLDKAGAFRDRDPVIADRALADARRSTGYALQDVRTSVGALRSGGVFRLDAALAELTGGLPVDLDVAGEQAGFSGPALLALYRAAQEGLTNVRRHAGARTVTVRVRLDATGGRLLVADDGCGFMPGDVDGFGLTGMRERLELVGGTLDVASEPGRGTRLSATVPAA